MENWTLASELLTATTTVLTSISNEIGNWWATARQEQPAALFAGAIGAFCGGVGAQLAIMRSTGRSDAKQKLIDMARSHQASWIVLNAIGSFRQSQAASLMDDYDTELKRFRRFNALMVLSSTNPKYVFKADFRYLPATNIPKEQIQKLLLENRYISGRTFDAATAIVRSWSSLEDYLKQRRDLIDELRNSGMDHEQIAYAYFGERDKHGNTDSRFKTIMEAIEAHSKDSVFFSYLMRNDLEYHSAKVRRRQMLRLRFGLPKSPRVIWDKAFDKDLIPNPEEYRDWLQAFRPRTLVGRIKRAMGSDDLIGMR